MDPKAVWVKVAVLPKSIRGKSIIVEERRTPGDYELDVR